MSFIVQVYSLPEQIQENSNIKALCLSDGFFFQKVHLRGNVDHLGVCDIVKAQMLYVENRQIFIMTAANRIYKCNQQVGIPKQYSYHETNSRGSNNIPQSVIMQANQEQIDQQNIGQEQIKIQKAINVDHTYYTEICMIDSQTRSFRIRGRVQQKSKLKHFKKNKEGKLFDCIIQDKTGSIKLTFFNDMADKYFDDIEDGQVYSVLDGNVTKANPAYNKTNHLQEIHINSKTQILEVDDQGDIPTECYNIVEIQNISNMEKNKFVDVIAKVIQISPVQNMQTRSGQQKSMQTILIQDNTAQISATFWGDNTQLLLSIQDGDIVFMKQMKVTDYNGKNLVFSYNSNITTNVPDTIQYQELLKQGDQPNDAIIENLSKQKDQKDYRMNFYTMQHISQQTTILEEGMKKKYRSICFISYIQTTSPFYYQSCPSDNCLKKVYQQQDQYFCQKCNQTYQEFQPRFLCQASLADPTGNIKVLFAGNQACQILFGKTEEEMYNKTKDMSEQERQKFALKYCYQQISLKVVCQRSEYNGNWNNKYTAEDIRLVNNSSAFLTNVLYNELQDQLANINSQIIQLQMQLEILDTTNLRKNSQEDENYNYTDFLTISQQIKDYQNGVICKVDKKQFLFKYNDRELLLFQVDSDLGANFLRRFVFYNNFLSVQKFQQDDQFFLFIFFQNMYLAVFQFDHQKIILNPVLYLNQEEQMYSLLKNSSFEKNTSMQLLLKNGFFYIIENNNKILVLPLKSCKSLYWLFQIKSKQIPQNNFLHFRQNVYCHNELFYNKTLQLNFKHLISDKILDIKASVRKDNFCTYFLISKSVPNLQQNQNKIVNYNIQFLRIKLKPAFLERVLIKQQKKMLMEKVFTNNSKVFEIFKNQIKKFYVFQGTNDIYVFNCIQFHVIMTDSTYVVLCFSYEDQARLSTMFESFRILLFSGQQSQKKIIKPKIEFKENNLTIIQGEFYVILEKKQNILNLIYFQGFHSIKDIDINEKIVYMQNGEKNELRQIEILNQSQLDKNNFGIDFLIECKINEGQEINQDKENFVDFLIQEECQFLVTNHQIIRINFDFFHNTEKRDTPKQFLNSWVISSKNNNMNILLIDNNYQFFLFDFQSKNFDLHNTKFQVSNENLQGYDLENGYYYVLVNNYEAYILDSEFIVLAHKIIFQEKSDFTVYKNCVISSQRKQNIEQYVITDLGIQKETFMIFDDESENIEQLSSDKDYLYITTNSQQMIAFNDELKPQFFYDLRTIGFTIQKNEIFEQNKIYSLTDLSVTLNINNKFSYPTLTDVQFFKYNDNKYMLCISSENEFFLYKFFEGTLIKLDINFPQINLQKSHNFVRISKCIDYVLIKLNSDIVILMFVQNNVENFKLISGEFYNSFIYQELVYCLSKYQIKIFTYKGFITKIHNSQQKIEYVLVLQELHQKKKYSFLCGVYDNVQKRQKLILISQQSEIKLSVDLQQNERITCLKNLNSYSVEKYQIFVGSNITDSAGFFPNWKIFHLPISSLSSQKPNLVQILSQSSQERNQKITNIIELERCLFICLENIILQIEGNKIQRVYHIDFLQIFCITQNKNYLIISDIKDVVKLCQFTNQRRELQIMSQINCNGFIKGLEFLQNCQEKFVVLDSYGNLQGYQIEQKKFFNQNQYIMQKLFVFRLFSFQFLRMAKNKPYFILISNDVSKLIILKTLTEDDFYFFLNLNDFMNQQLPYLAGCNSGHIYKNKILGSKNNIVDTNHLYQYLNQDKFLRAKFEDEVGFSSQKIINKMEIARANIDTIT